MVAFRHRIIGAGLAAFGATGLHRLVAPLTRGQGAILTFHRVTSAPPEPFAPNELLQITPAFLDGLLAHASRRGYRLVPLTDVPKLLSASHHAPFLALTFDDGYRDTLTDALPVLERHEAPFTVFTTTGFLDRSARLWWVELEMALKRLSSITLQLDGRLCRWSTRSSNEKARAFARLRRHFLGGSDEDLLAGVAELAAQAEVSGSELVERLCMNWPELARLARHPLATVGCHTLTHPRLASLFADRAYEEMHASRQRLEGELGQPVTTLCYPYGMETAAGPREFDTARQLGFEVAVTTRPGVLAAEDCRHPTALPRISVNGLWQDLSAFDVLLSGAGFPLWRAFDRLRSVAPAPDIEVRSDPAVPSIE